MATKGARGGSRASAGMGRGQQWFPVGVSPERSAGPRLPRVTGARRVGSRAGSSQAGPAAAAPRPLVRPAGVEPAHGAEKPRAHPAPRVVRGVWLPSVPHKYLVRPFDGAPHSRSGPAFRLLPDFISGSRVETNTKDSRLGAARRNRTARTHSRVHARVPDSRCRVSGASHEPPVVLARLCFRLMGEHPSMPGTRQKARRL